MTWPLQEHVRWHDGAPFTSADVCFTWKFVTSPDSITYNREQYLGIKDCETPDDHTVVFIWDGEYAYYAGLFEAILPRARACGGRMTTEEIVGYEPYNRGSATIGTGPFKFAEWKIGRVHPGGAQPRLLARARSTRRSTRSCGPSSPTPAPVSMPSSRGATTGAGSSPCR